MDLAPARAERSAPRTIDQEVFENESPIAAMERPAAFTADQLLVCGYRFGFDAHNLVLRAAGRTFERARTGGGHATPLIEWYRDRSNRRLRQLSLSQTHLVFDPVVIFSLRWFCVRLSKKTFGRRRN